MTKTGMIFERTEKKYLLSPEDKDRLLTLAGDRLEEDAYPHGTVSSLYLDTVDRRVIRASIDARVYKEKLRLRAYGTPSLSDSVFLELKKKYKDIVYKRREKLTLAEAYRYLENGILPRESQIFSEIGWMIRQNPGIASRAFISYERDAYVGREDHGLRITFDQNALYRGEDLRLEHGPYGLPVFPDGMGIMEIKTLGAIPLWLSGALDSLGIYPASFSKYGTAYEKYVRGGAVHSAVPKEALHA